MLKDNIKPIRKSKGLSQEELAMKLHVVRQTISKWEQGLSVPDSEMLIHISEVFDIPVSTLLGENISAPNPDDLQVISEKLEIINLQLWQRKKARRKIFHWIFLSFCVIIFLLFAFLFLWNSPYFDWDYSNPESAVLGVLCHSFEWVFIRIVPFLLFVLIIGIFLTKKKD